MDESLNAVQAAGKALISALQHQWLLEDFELDQESTWRPKTVHTTGSANARRLPNTGHLIRSYPETKVGVDGGEFVYGAPTIHNAVLQTLMRDRQERKEQTDTDSDHAASDVREAYARVTEAINATPRLLAVLNDSPGWKTFSHDEIIERASSRADVDDGVHSIIVLSDLVADALEHAGFRKWRDRRQFASWEEAGEHLSRALEEAVGQSEHTYEAVAYLNAPLVDSDVPVDLGPLPDNQPGRITLGRATDSDLSNSIEEAGFPGLPLGIARANSVLKFPLFIPVTASVEKYEAAYPTAERIIAGISDVLRLTCLGDFGVSALRLIPVSNLAPRLRRTLAWNYEPDNSPYIPRRQAYTRPEETIFSEANAETIRRLLPLRFAAVQPKGLEVALQRFRDSCERFDPSDPAQLLDVSIAFEAVLLNDGADKELRYRLRLRGARWLETDMAERIATFGLLGLLYDVRSKIAHGETLTSLDADDRAKIAEVLRDAPILLRRVLRRTLEREGPPVGGQELARTWWQKIELG